MGLDGTEEVMFWFLLADFGAMNALMNGNRIHSQRL